MKHCIFLFLLFINYSILNAQNCKSIGQNLVNKIKKTNYKDILPYYDSSVKKWGLMNKQGKALIEPVVESAFFFESNKNNSYNIHDYKGCTVYINYKDMSFETNKYIKPNYDDSYVTEATYAYSSDYQSSTTADDTYSFRGFSVETRSSINLDNGEVKKYGEITSFSRRFNDVKSPFYYKDKWYATATLKHSSKVGIIDQDGESLQHFDFNFTKLKPLRYYKGENKNERWYYFEDKDGNRGFVNVLGETKMVGDLLSYCSFYTEYHCIQKNEEASGVLDLRSLEWVIKPQNDIKLDEILRLGDYGYENCSFYVIAKEGDEQYLVDFKLKKYKLKHSGK